MVASEPLTLIRGQPEGEALLSIRSPGPFGEPPGGPFGRGLGDPRARCLLGASSALDRTSTMFDVQVTRACRMHVRLS